MKRIFLTLLAVLMVSSLFAAKKTAVLTPEQEADRMYAERNAVTDTAKALENADKTIAAFKKLYEAAPSDALLVRYIMAVDFKNNHLVSDKEARKQAYKDMFALVDKLCEGNTKCAESKYIAYANMTLWGRYGDLIDILEAATSGIADKVKVNSERLVAIDKSYRDWAGLLAQGRLHWKAPNIIFIMTWPDKNIAKKSLEEYTAMNPGSPFGKFYLADVLWDLGDREKAAALYREVVNTPPRAGEYLEDLKAKELCAARVKEQGIQ